MAFALESESGEERKPLKDWLIQGLRKAAESMIGFPTPEDDARIERLKDKGIMYTESKQGKQDRADEALRMASGFGPGNIGGAGIIRNVYHGSPTGEIRTGAKFTRNPQEAIDQTGPFGGTIHTVNLRRPDIVEEGRNPLTLSDVGGRSIELPDTSLVSRERKQNIADFLRSQEAAKRGEFVTKPGRTPQNNVPYRVRIDPKDPITRYKSNNEQMPNTEFGTYQAIRDRPPQYSKWGPEELGSVQVHASEGHSPYSGLSSISDPWKGKGIGTNIYDQIEKDYGRMAPSQTISKEAQAFWADRDPGALHRGMTESVEQLPSQAHWGEDWVTGRLDNFLKYYTHEGEVGPLKNDVYESILKKLRDKGFKFSWEK